MFNTQFGTFTHTGSNTSYIRTLNYSLPAQVADAINAVHPTTSFSGPSKRSPVLALESSIQKRELKERATAPSSCGTQITPACLQALYNIPATPANGTSAGGIGVTGMGDQYANQVRLSFRSFFHIPHMLICVCGTLQADLTTFLQNYRSDIPSSTTFNLTSVDGGTNDQTPANAGVEANLDIQYTVGVATNVPTTFVTVGTQNQDGNDGGFLDIINALLNETSPPKVLTTSYGFDVESDLSLSLTECVSLSFFPIWRRVDSFGCSALCNSYLQLTSKGVSILFASGDGGVASTPGVQCTNKPFPPTFPTCPYVTIVGATGSVPEVGASLSAGGFSNYFAQASWQASAVAGYLKILGSTYAGKYNASGRAYPDVSAQGKAVAIYVDGSPTTVDGTSCSSPIFASVIGLLNDELISTGEGNGTSLGFLNPWLYANPGAFNDITSGNVFLLRPYFC